MPKATCILMYPDTIVLLLSGSHHRGLQLQSCWIHHLCSPETHTQTNKQTNVYTLLFFKHHSLFYVFVSGIASMHVPVASNDPGTFRTTHSNGASSQSGNGCPVFPPQPSCSDWAIQVVWLLQQRGGSHSKSCVHRQEDPQLFLCTDVLQKRRASLWKDVSLVLLNPESVFLVWWDGDIGFRGHPWPLCT